MNPKAWIEKESGETVPIRGDFGLGRSTDNQVMMDGRGVSRRHALIHLQNGREYWLADLGSRNGTYLNGRRLSRPTRLRHGDRIRIGGMEVVFGSSDEAETRTVFETDNTQTVVMSRVLDCWLLVADVIDSTRIINEMESEDLSVMMGAWLSRCRDRIEGSGGTINKFLGDGFFAYWPEGNFGSGDIGGVLGELREIQEEESPPFRVVLHRGGVSIGGDLSPGSEELIGPEVTRVFRMEKLAGSLQLPRLASKAARETLGDGGIEFGEAGEHMLDGFHQPMAFHTW